MSVLANDRTGRYFDLYRKESSLREKRVRYFCSKSVSRSDFEKKGMLEKSFDLEHDTDRTNVEAVIIDQKSFKSKMDIVCANVLALLVTILVQG